MSSVLGPLAARYADWLALPDSAAVRSLAAARDESAWAMPVILRIERDPAPVRTELLEAAAAAAVAVCLDPLAEPDGPWHTDLMAWIGSNIRKVTRRARGAHWVAVQDLPGRTVTVGGAQARALVPGPVAEVPKEVNRLQIGGSEVPADEPGPPPAGIPVLWLNPTVAMTAGKAAAQVGHGSMLLAAAMAGSDRGAELTEWAARECRCAVRIATVAEWAELSPGAEPWTAWRERGVVAVRDAGFTEVAPGTVTVLARWPNPG